MKLKQEIESIIYELLVKDEPTSMIADQILELVKKKSLNEICGEEIKRKEVRHDD